MAACAERAAQMGIAGEGFTEELTQCGCERCSTAFAACLDDPDCAPTLACAAENNCLGVSCHQDFLCASVIDGVGGAVAAGPQLAMDFGDCMGAAACDRCGVPARSEP